MIFLAQPLNWILPAILFLAWIALWVVRRRVPLWFFGAGLLLAFLSVPVGLIAGRMELSAHPCSSKVLCGSMDELIWFCNGIFGVLTTVVLSIATLVVTAAVTGVRALNRMRAPRSGARGRTSG